MFSCTESKELSSVNSLSGKTVRNECKRKTLSDKGSLKKICASKPTFKGYVKKASNRKEMITEEGMELYKEKKKNEMVKMKAHGVDYDPDKSLKIVFDKGSKYIISVVSLNAHRKYLESLYICILIEE